MTFTDSNGNIIRSKKCGRVVMEPRLKLHDTTNVDILPLDAISMLTIVPKWMPKMNLWPVYFQYFQQSGYNMIHYAPISERGISNSPYSIKNQLSLSSELFEDGISESEKESVLKSMINKAYQNHEIFSAVDIVWNHTSCDSPWLLEHPEAGILSFNQVSI